MCMYHIYYKICFKPIKLYLKNPLFPLPVAPHFTLKIQPKIPQ